MICWTTSESTRSAFRLRRRGALNPNGTDAYWAGRFGLILLLTKNPCVSGLLSDSLSCSPCLHCCMRSRLLLVLRSFFFAVFKGVFEAAEVGLEVVCGLGALGAEVLPPEARVLDQHELLRVSGALAGQPQPLRVLLAKGVRGHRLKAQQLPCGALPWRDAPTQHLDSACAASAEASAVDKLAPPVVRRDAGLQQGRAQRARAPRHLDGDATKVHRGSGQQVLARAAEKARN